MGSRPTDTPNQLKAEDYALLPRLQPWVSALGELRYDRTAWASAIFRQTFHADQHAAAETVAELAADGHLSELSTDFFDDLSRPTAWPAEPTGSWWEEFAYSFE